MKNLNNSNNEISFRQVFRLVFVLFSLYLMGDAFSRWDGFSHYAAFSEFLPSVSLAFILWSILAVFFSCVVWGLLAVIEWISCKAGLKVMAHHLLVTAGFFFVSGALVWKLKKIIWPNVETTMQVKLIVLICVLLATLVFSAKSTGKAQNWLRLIQERITPLVWMFSVFVLLSVPIVAYCSLMNNTFRTTLNKTGQAYEDGTEKPNIILVTFDALAAREMSLYGYNKETTPFLEKWAEQATVFSRAHAESNFTASTAASLMTGKRVWTHETYHIEGSKPLKSDVESLPSLLKDNGYFNLAFVVNPFASVSILGVDNSFDIAPLASEFGNSASLFGWKYGVVDVMLYRAFGDKIKLHNWIIKNDFIFSKFLNLISRNITTTTVPPEKAFNRFLEIVDNNIPSPFFAWIHVFPPHDPYLPPEPFMGSVSDSSEMRSYKSQEKLIEYSYKYLFQYQPIPEKIKPQIDMLRTYYDEFVLYIDNEFKDFMEELDKRQSGNNVVIFSADHGESFDHGYFTHGGPFLYEQVTHIPLIIKEPGQTKGQVEDTLVEQIDIPSTILDLAGISVPSWMEGRSLVPLMRGGKLPGRAAFSMNFEGNRSRGHKIEIGSIAVWDGDYKMMHYIERDESVLFDLKRDPDELNDLTDKNPETSQRLLTLIKNNLREKNISKVVKGD